MNEKLAVLMEFNGYTKDELEAYLSLKFGSMTKGGMTASILSQSGYEKAKSVIFGQPQLNENQQMLSGSELIGVIYSQLLEDFGFGYIEKDLWMIAENLSEKIANDQPKLIPNQQIVLEWLKEEHTKNPELTIFGTLSVLFDESENRFMNLDVIDALNNLSNPQQEGVFQAFSKWALGQEEEK